MDITKQTSFIVRTDLINAYLKDINKFKPLTAEEEKKLFTEVEELRARLNTLTAKKKKTSDSDQSMAITREINSIKDKIYEVRNEIVNRYQLFVFAFAKRFDTENIVMDLVNSANLGLMAAFEDFDITTGNRFSTFSQNYIRRAIYAFLDGENLTVRTTNNARILPKVKKITNEFFSTEGRMPTDSEIIDFLKSKYGIEVKNSSDIYGARMEYIDASINEDDDIFFESSTEFSEKTASVNDAETSSDREDLSYQMAELFSVLDERELTIIKMKFGFAPYDKEYKNAEIADDMGLTSERVRQLYNSAKSKLEAKGYVA